MTAQSTPQKNSSSLSKGGPKRKLSLDTWAVALSFAISLLIWLGVIKHIPW
ncbi:MAG TPA: hypothetical protein VKB40_00120 [Candidatus Acidoferrales bacterium]|jgi:hypothetical protein|nr:hypothetical protein [Candidatus Acidoferrales bacterium]